MDILIFLVCFVVFIIWIVIKWVTRSLLLSTWNFKHYQWPFVLVACINWVWTWLRPSHHQPSMDAAAPQIGSVLGQIHRPEPLHHSVVGPLGDLCWCDVILGMTHQWQVSGSEILKRIEEWVLRPPVWYLVRGASPETVGCVGVEAQDLDGPLDAEMMENTAHFQRQQVLLGNRVFTKSVRLSDSLRILKNY